MAGLRWSAVVAVLRSYGPVELDAPQERRAEPDRAIRPRECPAPLGGAPGAERRGKRARPIRGQMSGLAELLR